MRELGGIGKRYAVQEQYRENSLTRHGAICILGVLWSSLDCARDFACVLKRPQPAQLRLRADHYRMVINFCGAPLRMTGLNIIVRTMRPSRPLRFQFTPPETPWSLSKTDSTDRGVPNVRPWEL